MCILLNGGQICRFKRLLFFIHVQLIMNFWQSNATYYTYSICICTLGIGRRYKLTHLEMQTAFTTLCVLWLQTILNTLYMHTYTYTYQMSPWQKENQDIFKRYLFFINGRKSLGVFCHLVLLQMFWGVFSIKLHFQRVVQFRGIVITSSKSRLFIW